MKYIQEMLPEFERICAEAKQQGLDGKAVISKQYIRYAKMEQKCKVPSALALIRRQKQSMANRLSRTHE